MNKPKKIINQIVIFFLLMFILLAGYSVLLKKIDKRKTIVQGDDFHWVYQVDSVEQKDRNLCTSPQT